MDKKQTKKKIAVLIELREDYVALLDKQAATENRKRKPMAEVIVMRAIEAYKTPPPAARGAA